MGRGDGLRRVAVTDGVVVADGVAEIDVEQFGAELAELAGFDPARDGYALTDVRAWLVAGATRELLVDVIGGIARRPSYRKPDRYFRYFNGAVTEAIRDRRSQPARAIATVAPADPERAAAIAAYNRAFTEWQNNGCMGPGPRLETGRAAA